MNIQVDDERCGSGEYAVSLLVEMAPEKLAIEERVPGVAGKAFDLKGWYRAWKSTRTDDEAAEPSRMTVEAADEFQADIPWDQLDQAVFLYEQDGKPIQKGYPLRLYVPDGSSECLNVKSIVRIRFFYDQSSSEATYGFKNQISVDELRLKK
ncbi:molybdopterin-dependent oxidoreductase [Paenibacillus rigui]|uniref:Oxidoreductase molybdopterin-binding domain-containing protein n=1 Tax=Paenibacillus rigui TaxID=554312 RepID=A0A229ULI7_9BACL|nr:molybdopterin-dependent oxidoreductase [Paenibacillus rigui]OXM84243.1 hypothetical protein CF651_20875 [Paenibacillus rigui]